MSAPGPGLDLYWIPLGAGERVVRTSGRIYERLVALAADQTPATSVPLRPRGDYGGRAGLMIEMAPQPDDRGRTDRGVVAEGAVGSRWLRPIRVFRYEVRCWRNGVIPDLAYAVASPVRVTDDLGQIGVVLDLISLVPTPVWGRDELRLGEMWNSNSVVSWVLSQAGLLDSAGEPPVEGRAPGWDAGVAAALGASRARSSLGSAA